MAQTVKRLSTVRETRVRSLGWEDPLEKEMAIHSSTIVWKIPWTEEPGRLQSVGSQRVGHDLNSCIIKIFLSCFYHFKTIRLRIALSDRLFFSPYIIPSGFENCYKENSESRLNFSYFKLASSCLSIDFILYP